MLDFHWIDPPSRDLVSLHRLDDLDAVLARRDAQLLQPGHRGRDIVRLQLVRPQQLPQTVYIKRERQARWKTLLRNSLAGCGYWTLARAEFEILQRLAAQGIGCPKPMVCLQSGFPRPRSCLVLEELADAVSLSSMLAGPLRDEPRPRRDQFFTALGREVARLHGTGIDQPELFTSHIFVAAREAGWQFSFLDFQRSTCRACVKVPRRIGDLAALWATLPRRLADTADREAFFDAYLSGSQLEYRGTEIITGVARRVDKLLTRRRIWEIRESDTEEHRSVHSLESIEVGQMWVDRDFRPALEGRGLSRFDAMMTTASGRCLRRLADRENWRLDLPADATRPGGAYLKRHRVRSLGGWLRAKVGAGPGETAGHVEARNVARLSRAGIAAMRLIAYGQKLHDDGLQESFVLTEELVGYTQLDHFLRQRFPAAERSSGRDRDLNTLIRDVAAVASKFHKLGYNHRDLYCCHFFIKETAPGQFKVNLIDLQRVEHRHSLRWRWLVKDLAQLSYSAPRDRIRCTHKMAFIKHYLGVRKLRPQDKRFVRQILAKQRVMEWNLGAHP
jgi:heptose I phosphotransferase